MWSVCVCVQVVRAGVVRAAAAWQLRHRPRVPRQRLPAPPLYPRAQVAAAASQAWVVARRRRRQRRRLGNPSTARAPISCNSTSCCRPSPAAPPLQPHLLSQLSARTTSTSSTRLFIRTIFRTAGLRVVLPWAAPWCPRSRTTSLPAWSTPAAWRTPASRALPSITRATITTRAAAWTRQRRSRYTPVPTATSASVTPAKTKRRNAPRS